MKKLVFVVFALFVVDGWADNTITSKEYVDEQVATLQEKIPAANTSTVLINGETQGEIGAKKIYNPNEAYAAQQDALVDAQTFNTAVQNALNSEFVCVEWLGNVHDNAHCLLYEVKAAFQLSKNLFRGPYFGVLNNGVTILGDKNLLISPFAAQAYRGPVFIASVNPGETYYISGKDNIDRNFYAFYPSEEDVTDGTKVISYDWLTISGHVLTAPSNAHVLVISLTNSTPTTITWSDVQCVLGSSPVPYRPYGENTWLPEK